MSRQAFLRPVAMPARSPAPPRCACVRRDRVSATGLWRACGRSGHTTSGRLPKAASAKGGDHVALIAAGMAAHEHLAVFARTDRKARLAILMRRAARHPCRARAVPAEGLGDGFSGHGAPRLPSVRRCRRLGRGHFFGPRPFGEHAEEAGDVVHDLAGVLVGEVAPETRLPDLPGAGDLLARVMVVCSVETFHRRPHGRLLAVPCSWSPVSESHR